MTLFESKGRLGLDQPRFPAAAGLLRTLLTSVAGRFRTVRRGAEYRRAEEELQSLPDYLLKDMGLARADIPRRVRGLPFE